MVHHACYMNVTKMFGEWIVCNLCLIAGHLQWVTVWDHILISCILIECVFAPERQEIYNSGLSKDSVTWILKWWAQEWGIFIFLCLTVLYSAVICSVVLCWIVQWCAVLYCIGLHCASLYSDAVVKCDVIWLHCVVLCWEVKCCVELCCAVLC